MEDPVQPVVKKEVRLQSGRVVDRIARHGDKPRVGRQIDPDADYGSPIPMLTWAAEGTAA